MLYPCCLMTLADVNSIPEHISCLTEIEMMSDFLSEINELYLLTKSLMKADKNSASDLSAAAAPLRSALDSIDSESLLEFIMYEGDFRCSWMFRKGINTAEITKLETYGRNAHQSTALQFQCTQWVSDMATLITDAYNYHVNYIDPLITTAQKYLNKTITMKQFSNAWEPVFVNDIEYGYSLALTNLQQLQIEYDRTCRALPDMLTHTLDYLFDYAFPILNYSILYSTELWSELVAKSSAPSIVTKREEIQSEAKWPPNLGEIIKELYEPFFDYPDSFKSRIIAGFTDFANTITYTKLLLVSFEQRTNPDNNFFL